MEMDYGRLKRKWAADKRKREETSEKLKLKLLLKGRPVFKRFGIEKVLLFGSVLNARSREGSDIDLLVFPLAGDRYWIFRHELEQALECPVDVYTQDDDPVFVNKVHERGEIIYEV
ncbi:MAG: nucleotidyltransferase domain-containing protein [Deltaproteobacteria bacterium]|nr:nucleotidyltransferase domain-containing protein [Deltaproteobacteria bacterium]MBW2050192.1 nucleotidyltransferase domain-containing protein [Deltaproteobacteria bacterium]